MIKKLLGRGFPFFILIQYGCIASDQPDFPEKIRVVLENSKTLQYERGSRLPLYLWPAMDAGEISAPEANRLVDTLNSRGVGLVTSWKPDNREDVLRQAITIGRAQMESGLEININATDLLYFFYNGDERTAHIDETGRPFWDTSFGSKKDMGCPFAIDFRKNEIRERIEFYLDSYKNNGLSVDFIFADWEIDGPLEVNRAFEASQRCKRCIDHLGKGFTFATFQKRMREMRSYLQYYILSQPVLSRFPEALVGNYAVYPNDGYRYWYDYFEYFVEGQPYRADQNAKYRQWYNDFPLTGYTFAMPVCYTWAPTFTWYDFENTDYRWFYNMLLVASNAGKSTPLSVPIISFVHWHTIHYPLEPDPGIIQMSRESYQELLWHMLLRGTDTFFMWSDESEFPEEVRLVHEVYAEAQQYGEFLEKGIPINFDVPDRPGAVISGLALDDKVLVRRTDFGNNREPVRIMAGTTEISVDELPGKCQLIPLSGSAPDPRTR
ncbi:MAG TPA: hypothetical protein VI583_18205 [Cyclobacteriaceae bacterium]|nr:hypothetical protein [Cyclobacteriaceae bacterium]